MNQHYGYPIQPLNESCSDPTNPHCTLIEDVTEDPIKQPVYDALVEYFQDPVLCKTGSIRHYSVYRSEIPCQLCLLKKYLVAYVQEDYFPLQTGRHLSELPWICFQTETSTQDYPGVRAQGYNRKKIPLLEEKIRVLADGRTEFITHYQADTLPLKVDLVPKNKDKKMYNQFEYAEEGTVRIALETFQTSITWSQ